MIYVNNKLHGFYSDIELNKPQDHNTNELKKKELELEGLTKSQRVEPLYTITRIPR